VATLLFSNLDSVSLAGFCFSLFVTFLNLNNAFSGSAGNNVMPVLLNAKADNQLTSRIRAMQPKGNCALMSSETLSTAGISLE